MTYPISSEQICSVCGESVTTWHFMAYTIFYRDFDGKPHTTGAGPEFTGVHQCPKCGYAAYNMADKLEDVKQCLESEEYKRVFKSDLPENAKKYICKALIHEWQSSDPTLDEHAKRYFLMYAGYCYVRVTWALNRGDVSDAYRIKACTCLETALPEIKEEEQPWVSLAVADIYRQAGEFAKAEKICEEWLAKIEEKEAESFKQELEHIRAKDTQRCRPKSIAERYKKQNG
jgi:hypothetical protein